MAPSSLPFPPTSRNQPAPNQKADQIVWKYLSKAVLVVANARLTSDSHDPNDPLGPLAAAADVGTSTPGGRGTTLPTDLDDAGTPTGSISVAAPATAATPLSGTTPSSKATTSKGKQSGPKLDKWFNLEIPDVDTFKPALTIFRSISTTFPISPSDAALDPPPLIVQVLLSIPQPALNQVLVLTHGSHRTRIDPTPRYILLESWRVDIARRPSTRNSDARTTTASSTSSATSSSHSLSTSGSSTSFYEVELPTVYKQSIALFRSMYTLLRLLPTWKLHRKLRRRTRLGPGGGMSLELRVDVPEQSATSSQSSTSSLEDLPPVIDNLHIIDFNTALSQHASANHIKSFSFPSIPSPLGELNLSVKYRSETNFNLESLESLLSSGFFSADQHLGGSGSGLAPIELFAVYPNGAPTYPKPPYPPVSRAMTREEMERERGMRSPSGGSFSPPALDFQARRQIPTTVEEEERDFEMVAEFTPTVVAEQQRRRKESQTNAAATPISFGGPSAAAGRYPTSYQAPRPTALSPRSQPGSLPREPLPVPRTGASYGSEKERESPPAASTSGVPPGAVVTASGIPPRSRFNSIPHSSSPLSQSPRIDPTATQRYAPLPSHLNPPSSPIITTPTQYSQHQPLPRGPQDQPEPPAMHSRTISMPSSSRPPLSAGPAPGSTIGRLFSRTDDLPFASPTAVTPGATYRIRKESTSAISSTTSSGGAASAVPGSPTRPGITYSPRSRPTALPSVAPPFTRRESNQLTPPSALGPVPLPTASGPRRPSLNTIHPFKSSTLSSSPGSFAAGRINSPLNERPAPSPIGPAPPAAMQYGSHGSTRQLAVTPGVGLSQSPRSPITGRSSGEGPSAPAQPPVGSYSPSNAPIVEGGPASKRLSGSSMESGGYPGTSSRRLSAYSPDLGVGPAAVPMAKRYSSSFSHRYANSTGSVVSGVPGSLGSGNGVPAPSAMARGDTLGLAGVSGAVPPTVEGRQPFSGAPTDDDDINAFVRAIDARPQLRGGTPPSRESPLSNPSTSSLPRVSGEGETGRYAPPLEPLGQIREGSALRDPNSEPPSPALLGPRSVSSRTNLEEQMSRMQLEFNQSYDSVAQRRQRSTASQPSEDNGGHARISSQSSGVSDTARTPDRRPL